MGKFTHKFITRFLFKKPFYGKSLVHGNRVNFLSFLLEKVLYEKIDGDVIECGVYRGGTLIELAKKLRIINSDKIFYALDTFEGHPYTDEGTEHIKDHFSDTDIIKVRNVIEKHQLNNVKLLKGKFIDTFPSLTKKKFCFAHLDCDLYQSYKECLEFLLPRMEKNGIIWFDDYNSPSALKANIAIEELIDKKDLIVLPKKQAYYVKQ